MPRGTAKITVIRLTANVPKMAGKMPPFVIPSRGGWVRNSKEMVLIPLENISSRITPRMKRTRIPARVSKKKPIRSDQLFLIFPLPDISGE
jgi:hypothetical protein